MSAKKVMESTKVPVEASPDSGYLSGPVKFSEEEGLDSGILSGPISGDIRHGDNSSGQTSTQSKTDILENESGIVSGPLTEELSFDGNTEDQGVVVDLLKEDLERCKISDKTPLSARSPSTPENLISIAKIFQQDADGDTVAHITAVHGCKMRTALLIKLCPDPTWLDITNDYGHTALHLAVMSGHAIIARMLVTAGASLAVRDHMGETPLHTAVHSGDRDCLLALLEPASGRQSMRASRASVFNQRNYNGQACVHIAARKGDVNTLQTLVYYGADINVKDGCAGWTPLHIAARAGDAALAGYLLQRCPSAARQVFDYAGRTPLRLARNTAVYKAFLDVYKEDDESGTDDEDGEELLETMRTMIAA